MSANTYLKTPQTNRIYKTRLFEMIFSQKKELLELCTKICAM